METKPKKKLDSSDYKRIHTMSGLGIRIESMAAILGLNARTFENILARDKQAKLAYADGKATVEHMVTQNLYEMLKNKDKAATFFYLKTQCRWKETSTVEVEGAKKLGGFKFKRSKRGNDPV